MMKSHQDRLKRENQKRSILIGASVLVFIVLISYFLHTGLQNGFQIFGRQVWKAGNGTSSFFSNISYVFHTKKTLEDENNLLKQELLEAQTRLTDRETLYQENLALKETLNRKFEGNFVLATVLAKPNVSLYDTLVLDIGQDSGILEHAEVFAYGSVLIGEIESMSSKTSTVKLFSTPGNKFTARITGTNVDVDVVGRGGGNFEMTLPRDVIVPPGTEIFIPGIIPHVIGLSGKTISDERDPFQKIILTTPININELNIVLVRK